MEVTTRANLAGELCADIRRRVGDGRQPPLKYMHLLSGFRLQVDDTSERLMLFLEAEPTTKEQIGYSEYDSRIPGMRWYLNQAWRQDVQFLLCRLGMFETETTEEVPF